MTANQIAGVLGEGITRNAVIGKLHRLGLSGSDKNGVRSESPDSGGSSTTADLSSEDTEAVHLPFEAPRQDAALETVNKREPPLRSAVTIAELTEGMCRWPAEEAASSEFRYCGQPTNEGTPYCADHCKLAYQPSKPMRRKPDRHSLFPGIVIEAPKG
jgi:GcrA cell cycle regulator